MAWIREELGVGRRPVQQVGHLRGVLGVDVVVGLEPDGPAAGEQRERVVDRLVLRAAPGDVAGVGADQQCRDPDLRVARRGLVLPQAPQHGQVAVEREPRGDRAVVAHLEVGEGALTAGFGPVGRRRLDPSGDVGDRGAGELRGSECRSGVVPLREPAREVDEAAVDTGDHRHHLGMGPRQLEHDVAAPRLTGDGRAFPPEVVDQQSQIVRDGGHVVAVVGLGRSAVPALVDGNDGVPEVGEVASDPVPQASVRGEAVHEQERRRVVDVRPVAGVPVDRVELDTGRERVPLVTGLRGSRFVHRLALAIRSTRESISRVVVIVRGHAASPRTARANASTIPRYGSDQATAVVDTAPSGRART
jgi:hypothetical protein